MGRNRNITWGRGEKRRQKQRLEAGEGVKSVEEV